MCVCVRACVRACARACVRVCVCVCVCLCVWQSLSEMAWIVPVRNQSFLIFIGIERTNYTLLRLQEVRFEAEKYFCFMHIDRTTTRKIQMKMFAQFSLVFVSVLFVVVFPWVLFCCCCCFGLFCYAFLLLSGLFFVFVSICVLKGKKSDPGLCLERETKGEMKF